MRSAKYTGLTLIEVLASLTLLATLLVAVLKSHDRLARQSRLAHERLAAIEAAERLLDEWSVTEPMAIPARSGQTIGEPSFHWTIETREDPNLDRFGVQVATLSVLPEKDSGDGIPLARVEFLTTTAIAGELR